MSRAPSALQTEARFQQWWREMGSLFPPQKVSEMCREAFHAGASYVATHAGLNETIQQAADGGTGD